MVLYIIDEPTIDEAILRLGKKTRDHNQMEVSWSHSPWVFSVSRGGLTAANDDFLDYVEKFEHEFLLFHGFPFNGLRRNEIKLIDKFKERLISKFG